MQNGLSEIIQSDYSRAQMDASRCDHRRCQFSGLSPNCAVISTTYTELSLTQFNSIFLPTFFNNFRQLPSYPISQLTCATAPESVKVTLHTQANITLIAREKVTECLSRRAMDCHAILPSSIDPSSYSARIQKVIYFFIYTIVISIGYRGFPCHQPTSMATQTWL